jgi:hypothetical protein
MEGHMRTTGKLVFGGDLSVPLRLSFELLAHSPSVALRRQLPPGGSLRLVQLFKHLLINEVYQ